MHASTFETRSHPFSGLTPDLVLDAIEHCDLRCDGRLLALNSYENRVFQVGQEEGPPVIAKFYRPDRWRDEAILEEHAFTQELSARELPVVSPLSISSTTLHAYQGFRFALYPLQRGRPPELDHPATLEWMGRFMGRIHAIGAIRPFEHRPTLDIESYGRQPRTYLLESKWIPQDLMPAWESVSAQALEKVRDCYERAGNVLNLRMHGDCHMGNVLWTDDGPHFVDFDDCRNGPAVQDLWMLLSGEREAMTSQLSEVLAGYEDFFDFNPKELHLVEALRTLRLVHYSAWLASRWTDPAFPAAFPWFNTHHYWQARILELREQIALMEEAPLSF